ncbi:ketosamine-3-kinase-like [Watersipora subatra]|uniref:ketosamine-3-kinase-like n=1 Tax=Watersipora subatra TaxID=2589382 RepID=UPI00355C7456
MPRSDAFDDLIKDALHTDSITKIGGGSGDISVGVSYRTKEGQEVFVKLNEKSDALLMFRGEEASLKALADTDTITCPRPVKILEELPGGGSALIMTNLALGSSLNARALGEGLARLHLHNLLLLDAGSASAVSKFGFHVPTCCGYISQANKWSDNWLEFFCEKIEFQLSITSSQGGEAISLWNRLKLKVSQLFTGVNVRPSLLHGDLWSGNTGQVPTGPVIFDPASFYGHHEYDLGIASMFGPYSQGNLFAKGYHSLIPKEAGFDKRNQLYQLFHYLNHWSHFGGGYRSSSIAIMKSLL